MSKETEPLTKLKKESAEGKLSTLPLKEDKKKTSGDEERKDKQNSKPLPKKPHTIPKNKSVEFLFGFTSLFLTCLSILLVLAVIFSLRSRPLTKAEEDVVILPMRTLVGKKGTYDDFFNGNYEPSEFMSGTELFDHNAEHHNLDLIYRSLIHYGHYDRKKPTCMFDLFTPANTNNYRICVIPIDDDEIVLAANLKTIPPHGQIASANERFKGCRQTKKDVMRYRSVTLDYYDVVKKQNATMQIDEEMAVMIQFIEEIFDATYQCESNK